MDDAENIAAVQTIYSSFGAGDIQGVLSHMAEDVVFRQPEAGASPLAGTYRGPREVGAWFQKMDELTETLAFEPREFVAQNNKVVALGYYRFSVRSTGKTWESEWAMVWGFREGKVVSFRFFGDTAAEAKAFE